MKRLFTKMLVASFALLSVNVMVNAQTTIDFESVGQDWSWTIFDNGTITPETYSVATNPDNSSINTSDNCGKYIVNANGQPWAGLWSDDMEDFTFTEANAKIKVMVYKNVISPFGLKFEGPGVAIEVKVPNTVVDEWEELTFDFTAHIGKTVTKLVLIPDFPAARTAGSINYFDNIVFEEGVAVVLPTPTVAAPTPNVAEANVISVFSDSYTDIASTEFNPFWNQATEFSMIDIEGNATIKYEFLNYQGIQLGSNVDASGMTFLNVDVWTPNETDLMLFTISVGSGEKSVSLAPLDLETWNTFSIPLTDFTSQGLSITDIHQFKIEGSGGKTVYIDNLYFSTEVPTSTGAPTKVTDVSFAPNPVVSNLSVSATSEIRTVILRNLSGKVVQTFLVNSANANINLQSLATGLYIMSVELANGEITNHKISKL